ncbi:hypothetical protein CAPTEDRAFT_221933 [Capitella teleta]|uniref:Translocation protein SEC62 n=1 Tax=Capitella teleta TaxID=283909 RepID=R7TU50_CAPTE|nr:hypothetical protein CAPTEDRAFT_221933 [Capitella teleta]|eukprot:ELT97428.1 hypothetical protein CAPTEDRAFT_221933 [Capitella teleta]
MGMTVQYFIASKAVDALLESKWSSSKNKNNALFTTRGSCVAYCNNLLQKGMFHRASRVDRKKEREKRKLKKAEEEAARDEKSKKEKKKKTKEDKEDVEVKTEEKEQEKSEEKESKEEKKEEKKDEEKKKKKEKKLKLEMFNTLGQEFKDGDEVYVWIYDPVPFKTFCIGLLLVLGAIGVCLFPLWPPEVRLGVYYLCLAAAGFVGCILGLCVVRLILFCVIWTTTFGKHHFWFLPNLTEDVGFFDSFKPLYKHNMYPSKEEEEKSNCKDEKGKEKEEESKDKNEKDESGSEQGYEMVNPEDLAEDEAEEEEEEEEGGGGGDEPSEPKKTR